MMRFVFFATVLCVANLRGAEFSRDLAPILQSKCLTCHNAEKAKGGYRVHTFAAVLQPGKSKKAPVAPNQPEESELFRRLVTHDEDDRMPQDDDPLPAAQIALFREWIAAGATLDRGETNSALALLIPRAAQPAPPEFYQRPVPILALAFTPDGKQIAASGYHEINFWDLNGKLQARVTNAPQRIQSISFSPTTNLFAIAGGQPGRSGEICIYQDKIFLTNLVQHSDELLSAAFSADGELLATGGSDNTIRIYKTSTWERLTAIQQHADWVVSVSFNPSGDKIVSASRDRTARVYDAETGELETTYTTHSAPVYAAAFIDAEQIASAGREKLVHIWDLKEGKKRHELGGAGGEIYEIAAGGGFIFVASSDKSVRQYSAGDRKLIRAYAHASPVYSIAYHAGSEKLAAGAYDGTARVWNVKSGALEAAFVAAPMRESPVASSPVHADAGE